MTTVRFLMPIRARLLIAQLAEVLHGLLNSLIRLIQFTESEFIKVLRLYLSYYKGYLSYPNIIKATPKSGKLHYYNPGLVHIIPDYSRTCIIIRFPSLFIGINIFMWHIKSSTT